MAISTHILDTSRGRPAAGVAVTLEHLRGTAWAPVGSGVTDADGRVRALWGGDAEPPAGTYRIGFDVEGYFAALGTAAFYPRVEITFVVRDPLEHHHVPLLLSPFGYSTYRGS